MNLLQKTNRNYLFFSAMLLLIAGTLLFMLITKNISNETNEKLFVNQERIKEQLERNEVVTHLPPVIEVVQLKIRENDSFVIKDTILYDPAEGEEELFREMTSVETINGITYRITMRQVMLEPHDFYHTIGFVLILVMVALLIGLLLINRIISRTLWKPFYQNLDMLKKFSLHENEKINLFPSGIMEFRELNEAIIKLTEKVRTDYQLLKEFTENASHEIQTPLAIVQVKLEMLLQSSGLNEDQLIQISSAYSSTQRLSKLNQTLLMLTKIGNHQFEEKENINLSETIEEQLKDLDDFIQAKNISVQKEIFSNPVVKANLQLVETLLSNLLGNAIRHNVTDGKIKIELKDNSLVISNTGKLNNHSTEKLFERFTKADSTSESLGLGLAIVKKICDINSWQITYTIQDTLHLLKINF